MDLTASAWALGYERGRVGCFLSNGDYGIPTTLPGGVRLPVGLPPSAVGNLARMHVSFPPGANPIEVVPVHPTQVYEIALMLLAFTLLWKLRRHRHALGWRFGVYLLLAGIE